MNKIISIKEDDKLAEAYAQLHVMAGCISSRARSYAELVAKDTKEAHQAFWGDVRKRFDEIGLTYEGRRFQINDNDDICELTDDEDCCGEKEQDQKET